MPHQPKVSIVIPVYNGSNYLRSAINGALNQTYQNIEVIVVDDGSNDNGKTKKIAESFGDKIRFFSKPNGGCGSALNLGIKNMHGELFSWLSHDDLYLPKKIERQVAKYLQQVNPDSIIFSGYLSKDGNNRRLGSSLPHRYLTPPQLDKPLYPLLRGLIHGCTLLIPKSNFNKIGIFNESLRTTQDYDLWFEFFRCVPLIYDDHVNVIARIHADQDTQKINALHLQEANELWLGFAQKLTRAEKTRFDNTEYQFLSNLATYLKITPFDKAQRGVEIMASELLEDIKISVILVIDAQTLTQQALTSSLESIANQAHQNLEFYLACNHPNLTNLIHTSLARYPNLSANCFLGDEHQLSKLVDQCITHARGKYIAFLHAPDTFMPSKLKDQLITLEYQGISFLASSYAAGESIDTNRHIDVSQSHGNIFPQALQGHLISISTVICHTTTLQNIIALKSYGEAWYARVLIWLTCCYPLHYLSKPLTHVSASYCQSLERNSGNSVFDDNAVVQLIRSPQFFDQFQSRTFQGGKQTPIASYDQYLERLQMTDDKHRLNLEIFSYKPPIIDLQKKLQTFADYEGFVVQNLKHHIPTQVWSWTTKLYRTLRNGVFGCLSSLGMVALTNKAKERIQIIQFRYKLYREENHS